ncbi:MAG: DUF4392 domain-containing protein [Chloroflexi bacterium]|nr:DUF4392 domain-containing protein [Chloroflexota bacterium]
MGAIEDTILARDPRGIASVRPYLPPDFCTQAARFALAHPGTVLIATGFFILRGNAGETDGPPGAAAMGYALQELGNTAYYVTDQPNLTLVRSVAHDPSRVIDFPIADHATSRTFAKNLLARLSPSLLIAVERAGFDKERRYVNRFGVDISHTSAKVDYLFLEHPHTIGIGDGGNEIGMGVVAQHVPKEVASSPAVTSTSKLIIAGASNWGAYGLVAALSLECGRNLLPSVEQEKEWVRRLASLGAVDGLSCQVEEAVDGFPLEENALTLEELHRLVARETAAAKEDTREHHQRGPHLAP